MLDKSPVKGSGSQAADVKAAKRKRHAAAKERCRLASCKRTTGPGLQGLCGYHNCWMLHWALGNPECCCHCCAEANETTPEKRESIQFDVPKRHRSRRARKRAQDIAILSEREKELDLTWLKNR